MHVGYVWMLLFVNYLGLLGAGMLLLACVRRYLDGKSFNTILIAGTITIIPIVALHLILIASITVFLLTANPSSNLSVFSGLGWSRNFPNLSQAWCFVEAQLTSTMLVSLMFSGLMQLYLPYAIFYHTEHNFDLPFLYPTRNSVIGIATFVLGNLSFHSRTPSCWKPCQIFN